MSKAWTSRTLWRTLDDAAASGGARPYVIWPDGRLTYGDVLAQAQTLSVALWNLGVRPGDRVALWITNRPEWVSLYYAIARLGAIAVPVNTRYRSHEVRHVLTQSGAVVLFFVPSFLKIDFAAILESLGAGSTLPCRCVSLDQPCPAFAIAWRDFLALAAQPAAGLSEAAAGVTPAQPVHIQYTSGTTAAPKAALLTQDQVARDAFWIGRRMRLGPEDRNFCPLPFYHVAGFVAGLVCALVSRGALVTTETFDAGLALALIERERCTALRGVETMALMELQHPDLGRRDLSSLRTAAIGTTNRSVTEAVYQRMGAHQLVSVYGMSETCSAACMTDVADPVEWRLSTLGRPLPGIEVRMVDLDSGSVCPPGHAGEIQIRGWNVMQGYFRQAEETRAVFTVDGWLHTGDLGVCDHDGNIRLTGRLRDMIRVGGENVAAAEIEGLLLEHPDVALAGVVGVSDSRLGEVPVAFVVARDGRVPDPEDIRAFCRGRMAGFKVPRHVLSVSELPLTGSGKVHKPSLREEAAQVLGSGSGGPA